MIVPVIPMDIIRNWAVVVMKQAQSDAKTGGKCGEVVMGMKVYNSGPKKTIVLSLPLFLLMLSLLLQTCKWYCEMFWDEVGTPPKQDVKILEPRDGDIVSGIVKIRVYVLDLSKVQPNHLIVSIHPYKGGEFPNYFYGQPLIKFTEEFPYGETIIVIEWNSKKVPNGEYIILAYIQDKIPEDYCSFDFLNLLVNKAYAKWKSQPPAMVKVVVKN